MSSEQTTQETVPVEKTETSTEPVKTEPTTETKPEVTTTTTITTSDCRLHQYIKSTFHYFRFQLSCK